MKTLAYTTPTLDCATGAARLLRLLLKLKVTQVLSHAQLLLAVAAAAPAMAAGYLSSCPSNFLEPIASSSSQWFVGMSLIGQLVETAAQGPDSILDFLER